VVRRPEAAGALASFARIARKYGPGLGARKFALLQSLSRGMLASAQQVLRLHELLCFLDAYPDDRRVHSLTRRMLADFRRRADLRKHRGKLSGSGIAGTDTPYRFFWPTAHWIGQHWPGSLVLDRDDLEAIREIRVALPSLLDPAQAEWLAGQHPKDLAPLDRLVPFGMTDADYVDDLIAALPGDEFSREAFGDRLDMSYVLREGRNTPERTTARFDRVDIHFQQAGLKSGYPDLRLEAQRGPQRIRKLRGKDALAAIRLARISMITRERDVAGFQFANPQDVVLVDDGQGLAFAMMGMTPARRATLPATYTALTLKNGVPIGYVQVELLGHHGALSFNTFETFRGAEAAWVFARFIAAAHQLFSCTVFSVEPYQLGLGNDEGIETGAWWFYQRMGFRPAAAPARRIAAREISRRKANPRFRSSAATLRTLARSHMFFRLKRSQPARLPRTHDWLGAATRALRDFRQADTADRRSAATAAALQRLGFSRRLLPDAHSRAMLVRWSGLVLALTSHGSWSLRERRQLLRLIRAKAGPSERAFARQLLRHRRLLRALDC
jgi:hypothetical protein